MIGRGELAFGDIVWCNFDPSVGHEFRRKRPAIVIQSTQQLQKSNLVTLIPVTSNLQKPHADDMPIFADKENNLRTDSVAKVHCITSFDYTRLDKKIGKIGKKENLFIRSYLRKHFGL